MKCEKCGKNEATTFVHLDNTNKEFYLCLDCAKERELGETFGLFTSSNDQKLCRCKTSLQEIKESGYVGCPLCYQTFREELMPIISTLHGHTKHKGKKLLSKAQKLKIQIDKAKKNNFYSLAEKLEKELKIIEEGTHE